MANDAYSSDNRGTQITPNERQLEGDASEPGAIEESNAPDTDNHENETDMLVRRISSLPPMPQSHNSAAAPASAHGGHQQMQRQQEEDNDSGDVEQRRALELLRSVDEDGDNGGQVIVCSAPGETKDLTPLATSSANALGGDGAQQYLTYGGPGSIEESSTQPAQRGAGSSTGAAADTAPADAVANLPADDSYIAQLTMRALEHEREDVLKVKNTGRDNNNRSFSTQA